MSERLHNGFAQIETVTFSGGALQVIADEAGRAWMLLQPACRALGLDVEGQRVRLERTPWAATSVMQAEGAHGKQRSSYCLRSDRVAMWLATISIRRVRPELRERVAKWQCEAAEALARWAAGRAQAEPSLPPLDSQRPLLAELRQLIEREVRSALQRQLPNQPPPAPLVNSALRYGILLPCPDAEGWQQLALGVKQCCGLVAADCLTSAKMAQLLEYEAGAVPELRGAVEKLTGRPTLSGRQLGYVLSCAQKRGLVEHDGRLHSHGGYGWSAVDRASATRREKRKAEGARAWLLPATEPKAVRAGGA